MYCKRCGKEMADDARFCPSCGCYVDQAADGEINGVDNRYLDFRKSDEPIETAAVIFAILGFIIPLIGLIATIVYYKDKPKDAKVIGIASLVGFIFWFFFWGY